MPNAMKQSLFIVICSITTYSLSLYNDLKPCIVLPEERLINCVIGNDDCNEHLKEIQNFLIHVINYERSKVARGFFKKMPIATNMLYVEIDENLKHMAQSYAETCLIENNTEYCLVPVLNGISEASVFVTEYEIKDTLRKAFERAAFTLIAFEFEIERFTNETLEQIVKEYRPPETEPTFHNFAKFLQADVWKVGCGFADFLISDNKFKEVVVCFYGPPKLETGKELYIAGCVPCSNCPHETSCIKDEPKELCEVNPGKSPEYYEHKKWEKEICFQPQESFVWRGNKESSAQQCRGTNSCFPGWQYENDYAYINMTQTCLATAAFKTKIYIEEESCFTFYHRKSIGKPSKHGASIMAFAFEVNDQSKGYKKEKRYKRNHRKLKPIHLLLPWTDTYIHVGFGARSKNENEFYRIEGSKFRIEKGQCSHD